MPGRRPSHAGTVPPGLGTAPPPAAVALVALVVSLVALVTVLVAAGSAPAPSPAGLSDAGAGVRWAVPVGRLLLDAGAVLTVGSLLVASVLHPAAAGARRTAAGAAAVWSTTAVVLAATSAWEATGLPPDRLPLDGLVRAVTVLPPARALLLVAVLAAAAGVLAGGGRRDRPGAAAALVVAVVALTPTLYVGHSAHLADDRTATGALVVHVVAATVWLGGLVGLALHVRVGDPGLPAAVGRFSTVALGAYAALVGSGVLVAVAGLGTSRSGWSSAYAGVVLAKVALAAALGAVGAAHRRWTIARLRAGRPRAFGRLVAVELVVMGIALGSAVALSRMPGATAGGLRPGAPASGPDGSTLGALASVWRPEPVVATVVLLGVAVLLRDAWRGRPPGEPWGPLLGSVVGPVTAAVLALAVLGLPVAGPAGPLVGSLAVQHLVLLLVVPALAAAGARRAPWTRDRSAASTGGAHRLDDPATGLAALVAVVLVLAVDPVRDLATPPAAHVVSLAVALAGGLVLHRTVLSRGGPGGPGGPGVVAGATPGGSAGRLPALVVGAGVLAAAAAVVARGGTLLDPPAPGAVGTPAGPVIGGLLADPLLAAGLLAAAAVALGVLAAVVGRPVRPPRGTGPGALPHVGPPALAGAATRGGEG